MLYLTRSTARGKNVVYIGHDVRIEILDGGNVRLGIDAPKDRVIWFNTPQCPTCPRPAAKPEPDYCI